MATQPLYPMAVDSERLQRIEQLIRRYPEIDDDEREEIIRYLKKGPVLDTALLTGFDGIGPRLERFRGDYRDRFGPTAAEYAVVAVIVLVVILLGLLLWNAGAGG